MDAPDGNPAVWVNADGAWNLGGRVQLLMTEALGEKGHQQDAVVPAAGAVTDGKSWPQITIDETLYRAANTRNGLDLLPERTQTEPVYPRQDMFGPVYSMQYKGKTITFSTDLESNCVSDYFGPVSAFFNNFPEQGMELRAFYDNTGYESPASGRHVVASSGMLDSVFRLPMASYRVGDGYLSNERFPDGDWLSSGEWFSILLASGDYQTWDIKED